MDDHHGRACAVARVGFRSVKRDARRAITRIQANVKWARLDDRPYFDGETEACINGAILAFGSYFRVHCERIVDRLIDERFAHGSWNCDAPPSTRSSLNSTIGVLEGLLEYERAWGSSAAVTGAPMKAHEYLLQRRMFRRLTTGEIVDRKWTRFTFPTMWHYDILRGLDYLQSASVEPDERVAEAVGIVKARRHQNGRWPMNHLPRRSAWLSCGTANRQREPLEYVARHARVEVVRPALSAGHRLARVCDWVRTAVLAARV